MITDAEFWMEVRRRKEGRDDMFKGMLALIHAHQCRIDSRMGSLDEEEERITKYGQEYLSKLKSSSTPPPRRAAAKDLPRRGPEATPREGDGEDGGFLRLPGAPAGRVAPIAVRVLQQVLLFAVPIYRLRYSIPAMSMGWSTSCLIDRARRQLVTFGASQGIHVPDALQGRGCVAGDGFFAILTSQNEIWASGGLQVSRPGAAAPTALGEEATMACVATRAVMLAGHGQRLAALSRNFVVRALSAVCAPTRSVIPSRRVRFLDLGYGEDYHMVGMDSALYKITSSRRMVSTPRQVMSFSQRPVSRVACGMGFLLVIDQNGQLYTCGRNRHGQLGNGKKQEARRKPYLVEALRHHFITQVAAGELHALALTSSGVVYAAGANESGQLGLGPGVREAVHFTPVPLPRRCVGIAAGPVGSMFLCVDGRVLTCGLNDCMQLGLNTTSKIVFAPTPISMLSGVETYTISFGGYPAPSAPPDAPAGPAKEKVPRENTEPAVDPLAEKPHGVVSEHARRNGQSNSLNRNQGKNRSSPSIAFEADPSHLGPTLKPTGVDAGGSHEGKLGHPYGQDNGGAGVNNRAGNTSNEPISITGRENQASVSRINSSALDGEVPPTVSQQSKKVSSHRCGKCCIVL